MAIPGCSLILLSTLCGTTGFAVVKKGKDRKTGQPVAIKVEYSCTQIAATVQVHVQKVSQLCAELQVVDKSRYATGDNSLQREIQVLCKVWLSKGNHCLLPTGLIGSCNCLAACVKSLGLYAALVSYCYDQARHSSHTQNNVYDRPYTVLIHKTISAVSVASAVQWLQLFRGTSEHVVLSCVANSCLMQVQHPNCISLYAVYITPRKVYLVTELVTGGELLDR